MLRKFLQIKQISDWAVKCLSLVLIKSEDLSKMCSIVTCSSHPMHIGSSSPFNKKWVMKEWQTCNRAIIVSSFLLVWGQTIYSFRLGHTLCSLFFGNSSHSDCQSSNIYLLVHAFMSEKGMSSTEMSPTTASLAAESAAKLWPGTQTNTIFFPISGQIHIKFQNLHQNRVVILQVKNSL